MIKIVSVNIAKRQKITWKGKERYTGIFKNPINNHIFLGKNDVKEDVVIDRKHHGGENMAVYAFSLDHYAYFKKLYPNLIFKNGMFGENLTLTNFDERIIKIGDIFKVGNAIIQVSQPRLPCSTLGIRFKSQNIVRQFLHTTFSGSYFKVLQEGTVFTNDTFKLLDRNDNNLTLAEVYSLFTTNKLNTVLIEKALKMTDLSTRLKADIKRKLK